ncbi:MAG: hypothetical protein OJF59_002046 [Cytophagales bacterium]|nr:MAG: hypothetical protein OJF59_002046 [Cytophagales bacterium]
MIDRNNFYLYFVSCGFYDVWAGNETIVHFASSPKKGDDAKQ